jgi:hypothetical protein
VKTGAHVTDLAKKGAPSIMPLSSRFSLPTRIVNSTKLSDLGCRGAVPQRRDGLFVAVLISAFFYLLIAPSPAFAQNAQYTAGKADQALRSDMRIDPSTLGMSIEVPLGAYPGRAGVDLPISLRYSSKQWRIDYSSSFHGQLRDQTWTRAKYAESSAAGWTSSLDVPRIVYSGDGEAYELDTGNPYVSDIDNPNPAVPCLYQPHQRHFDGRIFA